MDLKITEQCNDEQLMIAYIAGNNQAFEWLYVRHKDKLYRYFLRHCSSPETAQELYQDCWLKVIKNRQQYQVKAKFLTWLYTIAHHHLVDFYRKTKKIVWDFNPDQYIDDFAASPLNMPDNEFQQQQLKKQLEKAITMLPLEQRQIFLLHEKANFSIQQIADITGDKKEAVKSRYRYAIQKLRKILGGIK